MNEAITAQARADQANLSEALRLKRIIGNALVMLSKPAEHSRREVKEMLTRALLPANHAGA